VEIQQANQDDDIDGILVYYPVHPEELSTDILT
jgi:5,10-methylene-tetrahydrofolate dehydrogenase/methenyl tetrahydrofolate cyclohydrolase